MKKQIEPHLKQAADIRLPACEFCRTVTCRNCIHFEMHSPDSEGNCRCDYRDRWYAPHHGCGNGTTWQEYYQKIHEEEAENRKRIEERQEIQERRQNTSFRNTTGSNTSRAKPPPKTIRLPPQVDSSCWRSLAVCSSIPGW